MCKMQTIIFLLSVVHISMQSGLLKGKIQKRSCDRHTRIMNDCNWCVCGENRNFQCGSRDCKSVDMFGHFKDTVQEIDVGMEGKGSWRSTPTACDAGVHYRRSAVLCVCNEDGNWPNPVCRDLFRVLHSVEATNLRHPSRYHQCTPTRLYLIGCNVCFCPSKGFIDPGLCTTRTCDKEDPILLNDVELESKLDKETEEPATEIYAQCTLDIEYNLGCKTCSCLRNNRLLCDNCTDVSKSKILNLLPTSFCSNRKPGEIFNHDCNLCFCDKSDNVFCTTRKCISDPAVDAVFSQQKNITDTGLVASDTPFDAFGCVPGTKFNRDCNSCNCLLSGVEKVFSCSLKQCSTKNDVLTKLKNDCVEGSFYESNCLICSCKVEHGVKWERCHVNQLCLDEQLTDDKKSTDLESLHGYCEPLHVYNRDCNTCRCLADGKIVQCTTKRCDKFQTSKLGAANVYHNKVGKEDLKDATGAITVDIIPIKVALGEKCPQGYSYKIDCNFCYCLKNGNALCTTQVCN